MNNTNITISFQILLLNDLLNRNVIDRDIYNRATQTIETIKKEKQAA